MANIYALSVRKLTLHKFNFVSLVLELFVENLFLMTYD